MFLTTEDTENTEMKKVKLRFIRGYANATHADLTQVKNVPLSILITTVYHRIYINAVVASHLISVANHSHGKTTK